MSAIALSFSSLKDSNSGQPPVAHKHFKLSLRFISFPFILLFNIYIIDVFIENPYSNLLECSLHSNNYIEPCEVLLL